MRETDITEETLISILRDPAQRSELLAAMGAETGAYPPITNRYADVAMRCKATSDELREVLDMLLRAPARNDDLIEGLIFHPNIPAEVLYRLFEDKHLRFDTALAHVAGPREFLEMMAATQRHSEAVATLLLSYYATDAFSNEEFADFIHRNRWCWNDAIFEHALKYAHPNQLSDSKRAIALSIIKRE